MLEFLSIDIGTILFTICNLLILVWVFKHFLFGRVYKILDERQNDVSETYAKADEAMEHAKSLESEYTGLMEGAKEESAEMIKAASKKRSSVQMRSFPMQKAKRPQYWQKPVKMLKEKRNVRRMS